MFVSITLELTIRTLKPKLLAKLYRVRLDVQLVNRQYLLLNYGSDDRMVLSNDLVSQFAKVTKIEEPKRETICYGTIVTVDGKKCVQLDGSGVITPILSTAEANNGERVTVMIKNHTAIVTGNITSPSARSDDVRNITVAINGIKATDDGLLIAESSTEPLLYNILLSDLGIGIRKGTVQIVGFSDDSIEIGNSNIDTNIYARSLNYYINGIGYKPYYSVGDIVNIDWYGTGFVSNSSGSVYFSLSLSRPIIGNPTISVESVNGLIVRQDSNFLYGSSFSSYAAPSSYSCTLSENGGILNVVASFENTTNAQNEAPCGINASVKITLT